jgi:hypothetical protein
MYAVSAIFAFREIVLDEKSGSVIIIAKQRAATRRNIGALATIRSSIYYFAI